MKEENKRTGQEPGARQEEEQIRVVNAEELAKLPEVDEDKRPKRTGWIWESGSDGGSASSGGAA